MLFNSYIFILFFLPMTLFLYFGLNHFRRERAAKLVLTAMSLWFYAYFHVGYLAVILISVFMNYMCNPALRKVILSVGIVGNVSVIFYFKYFNFLLENMNYFLHSSFVLKSIYNAVGHQFLYV